MSAMRVARPAGKSPARETLKPTAKSGIRASREEYEPMLPSLLYVVANW